MELDHVLIAVADLADAAQQLEARYGLASVEGGRHPGWGTANRIVPLGGAYLELIAVADRAEAATNAFGRWVAAADGLLGWAVRTDRLDDVARRLDLTVSAGSRARPDGRLVRWRLAGVEQAAAEPALPFFIEWEPGTPLPGRTGTGGIAELRLDGDAERLTAWLGPHRLPIAVRPGAPAVTGIVIAGTAGEVILDAALFPSLWKK